MRYFLGVDVGSSKTHALVADETGQALGFGRAGAGNRQGVGYAGLRQALQESVNAALHMAGLDARQMAGAGFGVAGYDWPSELADHLESIAVLGLDCPLQVANDAINGLMAGTTHGWGVAVSAGTSNNCRGRDRQGREGRIVGNGPYFGEYGGAIEIVQQALIQVNYEWIRRGPPTALTPVFLAAAGASDLPDLMEGLSNRRYGLGPELAIQVFQTAEAGDHGARKVIEWAGEELGWLAVSVIRQLGLEAGPVEVVQSGSLYAGGRLLTGPMERVVRFMAPQARFVRLQALPVVGSLLLGMQAAGVDGYAVRPQLIETTRG